MALEFKEEGYEFRGWKLGQTVMYEGKEHKVIGFDESANGWSTPEYLSHDTSIIYLDEMEVNTVINLNGVSLIRKYDKTNSADYNLTIFNELSGETICTLPVYTDRPDTWKQQQKLLKSFGFDVELTREVTLPPKFYIRAKTKKRWMQIMRALEKLGYVWSNGGDKPTEFESWEYWEENSVIYVEENKKIQYDDDSYIKDYERVKWNSLRSFS